MSSFSFVGYHWIILQIFMFHRIKVSLSGESYEFIGYNYLPWSLIRYVDVVKQNNTVLKIYFSETEPWKS